jgi:hypothetical protein
MITIDPPGARWPRLTRAQLAAQAGISTTAMNNIEHGTDAKGLDNTAGREKFGAGVLMPLPVIEETC